MVANCAMVLEDRTVSSTMPAVKKLSENSVFKKSENRRSNKPIMEKRRRARINNCLNELKTLILETTKRDPARHTKLEKADILEMTVKYLESNKKKEQSGSTNLSGANHFKAGFSFCTNAISKFPGLDLHSKRKLLQHISDCWNQQTLQPNNKSTSIENYKNQTILTNIALLLPHPLNPSNVSSLQNLSNSEQLNQSVPILLPVPQRTSSTSSSSSCSRTVSPDIMEINEITEDSIKPLSLVVNKRIEEEVPGVWRPF